ncbi:MAG: hypothetical protein ACXVRV_10760 [Gaiellaceae bacterium]
MRRVFVLASIAALLAACGSTTAGHTPIVFGITGGNIAPYRVSIEPNGSVRARGSHATHRQQISPARVRQLRLEIERADLASRRCAGALPDIAGRYIRFGGRMYVVHGGCEARFQRVWLDLVRAVGILRAP